uniref:Uncharacterized protein n=1 Tax=Oryza rufipogon TaxID=4529 RepID=A0A0E0MS10_ORYRU
MVEHEQCGSCVVDRCLSLNNAGRVAISGTTQFCRRRRRRRYIYYDEQASRPAETPEPGEEEASSPATNKLVAGCKAAAGGEETRDGVLKNSKVVHVHVRRGRVAEWVPRSGSVQLVSHTRCVSAEEAELLACYEGLKLAAEWIPMPFVGTY